MRVRVPEDRGNGLTRVYDLKMNTWTYSLAIHADVPISGEFVRDADIPVDDYVRLSILKTMRETIDRELKCINQRLNIG